MRNIRLIALDLDGTLLDSEKRLTKENAAALQEAAEAGIEIVPATGRFYKGMPEVIRDLPYVHYTICINGAQVYDVRENRTVGASEIPWQRAVELMTYMDSLPVIYDCYQNGWGYMSRAMYDQAEVYAANPHSLDMILRLRTPVPDLKEYLAEKKEGVQKVQMFFRDMEARAVAMQELKKAFPDLEVTTSIVNNIEINSKEATKSVGLKKLADYLQIDMAETMAFGDDLNDVTILAAAGIGVAMGNSCPEAKEAADHVTSDCDHSGVAEAIRKLVLNEKKGPKMNDIYRIAENETGLTQEEIREALLQSLEGRELKKVLILPPDFTRFHSNAGFITNVYYHTLKERGVQVDVLPALGTHVQVSEEQWKAMFGDIPYEEMLVHNWRTDVVKLGEVPGEYLSEITEGLWTDSVSVEVNRRVMDESYDLIISPGQVVPHEVIGMSNHAKNLFVGVGGSEMINRSHMVGAVYGMERMMGRDYTPVRKMFDYGVEHFLKDRPLLFVLTVTTAPGGNIRTHGLFIGEGRECLTEAVKLAQEKNIDFVEHGLKKCVVYLDPSEFKSTWLGNKAVYRTRMAMADGGELIILAPGVERFGEDDQVDTLIRKYGYRGRLHTLEEFRKPENTDLQDNMGAAAHLIHGSSDGRFSITYAVKDITKEEIESVGFCAADYDEMAAKYDPKKLRYGYNEVDGEEIYFIPNPALGLWINREKFAEEA